MNRSIVHEIFGWHDGRWVIDTTIPDEDGALAHAQALLKSGRYEEVKVVRQRTAPNGFTMESEIFREAGRVERPIGLAGDAAQVPVCRDLESVYGFEARIAVGRLLRHYLDRENVTATELLHLWPCMRRLDGKAGHLLAAAIHKIGSVQAETLGIAGRERMQALQRWVAEGMARSREFDLQARKMVFDPADYEGSAGRVEAVLGPALRRWGVTVQLCYLLMSIGSVAGKLEKLIEIVSTTPAPELAGIADEIVADGLDFPSVLQDVLSILPNRAAKIGRIADLVNGRYALAPGERADPVMTGVARLRAEGKLPRAADTLLEWVLREMGRAKPLDEIDPRNDDALFPALLPRLRDAKGTLLGGIRMQEAIGRYRLAARQRVLRGMGMEDQANELAKYWSVDMVERVAPLHAA